MLSRWRSGFRTLRGLLLARISDIVDCVTFLPYMLRNQFWQTCCVASGFPFLKVRSASFSWNERACRDCAILLDEERHNCVVRRRFLWLKSKTAKITLCGNEMNKKNEKIKIKIHVEERKSHYLNNFLQFLFLLFIELFW